MNFLYCHHISQKTKLVFCNFRYNVFIIVKVINETPGSAWNETPCIFDKRRKIFFLDAFYHDSDFVQTVYANAVFIYFAYNDVFFLTLTSLIFLLYHIYLTTIYIFQHKFLNSWLIVYSVPLHFHFHGIQQITTSMNF